MVTITDVYMNGIDLILRNVRTMPVQTLRDKLARCEYHAAMSRRLDNAVIGMAKRGRGLGKLGTAVVRIAAKPWPPSAAWRTRR